MVMSSYVMKITLRTITNQQFLYSHNKSKNIVS